LILFEKLEIGLLKKKWLTEEELKAIDTEIRTKVDNDAKDAEGDRMLTEEELVTDIYSTGPPSFVRYGDFANSIVDGKHRVRDLFPEYATSKKKNKKNKNK